MYRRFDWWSHRNSAVSCPATNVTLIVDYGAAVVSTSFPNVTISGDTATFYVDDLDTWRVAKPVDPVVSIAYSDDQGNSPDFTAVLDITSNVTFPPGSVIALTQRVSRCLNMLSLQCLICENKNLGSLELQSYLIYLFILYLSNRLHPSPRLLSTFPQLRPLPRLLRRHVSRALAISE